MHDTHKFKNRNSAEKKRETTQKQQWPCAALTYTQWATEKTFYFLVIVIRAWNAFVLAKQPERFGYIGHILTNAQCADR